MMRSGLTDFSTIRSGLADLRGILERDREAPPPRLPTCKLLAVVCSSTSFSDIALAASLGALLWGVELLAAGGFGNAEAATHLGQGTMFAAGAVGFGCTEPAAVEVRAQLAADRPSGWELLAAIGKSEASGLAPRRGEGEARGSLHAATAGVGDTGGPHVHGFPFLICSLTHSTS